MIRVIEKDKMQVQKLEMIPVECVVRGYFYGSLVERYKGREDLPSDFNPVLASKLNRPIFDPTTKSEEHDIPIDRQQLVSSGVLSGKEYDYLETTSISLYESMAKIVELADFILADVKFEFGRNKKGEIVLGDSLGPDEYRLWLKTDHQPGKIQESYDKQLLRDWLIKIGFKDDIDRLAIEGKKPESPEISQEVANELSRRYILAFERISGRSL